MASSGRPRLSRYSERYPLTEADGTNSELWTDYDGSDDNAGGAPLYSTVRRYDVPIWQTWNDDAYSVEEENREGPYREPSYLQSQISPQFPQTSLSQRPLPEISHRASAPYVEPVEKGTTSAGSWNAAFPFKHRARNTKCKPPPLATDTQHLMSTNNGAEESDARYNDQASSSRDGAEDAALTNPWHRPVYAPGDRRQVDEDEEWDQQLLWQHSDGVRPNHTTHVLNPWHVPTGGKRQIPRMGVKLDTRKYTGGRQTGTSGVHPVGTYDCFDAPTASSSGDSRWNSHSSADMVLLPKSVVKKQLLAGRRSDVLCGVLVVLLLLLLIGALPLLYWKLDPSQTGHLVQVKASFRITNWNFSDALNDKDSTEFKKKQKVLCDQLTTKTVDIHCRVTQFRNGSVICDFGLEGRAVYQRQEASLQANIIDRFVEAALSSNFTGGDIDPSSIAVSGSSRPMCSESRCGADQVCVEKPPIDYKCYSLDPERVTSPDRVAPADIVTSTTPTTTTITPTSTTTTPTTTTITPTTSTTTPISTTTTPTNTTTTLSTTTTTGTTATTTLTTTSATPDTTTTSPDTTTTTPDATTTTPTTTITTPTTRTNTPSTAITTPSTTTTIPDATTTSPDTTTTTPDATTTTLDTTTTIPDVTTTTTDTTTTTLDATTTTPDATTTTTDTTTTTPDATTTTPDATTTTPDATTTTTLDTTTTTPDATTTTPDATTTTLDTTTTTPDATTTTPDATTTTPKTTTTIPKTTTTTPDATTTTPDATTTTPKTTTTIPDATTTTTTDTTTTTPDATTTTPKTTTTIPDATTTTTDTTTTTPDATTTSSDATTTTPDTTTTTSDATTTTPDTTATTPTTTPTTTTTTPATTTTPPSTRTTSTTTTSIITTTTTPTTTTTAPDTTTTTLATTPRGPKKNCTMSHDSCGVGEGRTRKPRLYR